VKKVIATLSLITFCVLGFSAPVFTPKIDGNKEAEWGNTPDATSEGEGFDNDPCKYLYVTDDGYYLYILYWYQGDQNASDGASAHSIIAIDTKEGGGNYDPWQNQTKFSNILPDFIISSYHNSQNGLRDIQLRKWENNSWKFLGSLGEDEHYENIPGIAELRIPLSTLGIGKGKEIKIVHYYRYNENNPGISDSTPYNSSASPQSTSPATLTNFLKYTIRGEARINNVETLRNVIKGNEKLLFLINYSGNYEISIYSLKGIKIKTITNTYLIQGQYYELSPEEIGLNSGVYILRFKRGDTDNKVKFIIVR